MLTEVQKTNKKQWHREAKRPDLQLYQPGVAQARRWREDTEEETGTESANNNPDPTMPCSSVSDQMPDHHVDCNYKEQSSDPQQTEGRASKDCTSSAGSPASQKVRRTRKPDREIYQPGGRRSHRETVPNKGTDQVVTAAEETGFERGGVVEHGEDIRLKGPEKKEEKGQEPNGSKKGGRKKQMTGKPKNIDSTITNSNETAVEKITKRTEHLHIREEEGEDGGTGGGGKEKKEKRKARKSTQPENKERLQSVKVSNAVHPLKNNGEQINEKERDSTKKNHHDDRNLQKGRRRGDCAEDWNKETHRACWETEPQKESSVTKRYSKSDIRRPRNRNYSTSSASSANSVDGQGESRSSTKTIRGQETGEREAVLQPHQTGGGKKTWSRAEQPRRWRDASTTDSLEEPETWDGAPEGDVFKNKAEKKNRGSARSKGSSRGGKGPLGNHPGGLLKVNRQCETTSRPVEQLREQGRTGRGRGILVLPAHTELSTSAENMPRPAYGIRGGTGHGRERGGRGGSTRRLWDPNNPDKKPALTKNPPSQHSAHLQPLYLQHQGGYAPLHFLDTDDETSPVCLGENFQTPYCYAMANYKYQNSENPYGYPVAGSTPPQYPCPPQFHYQMPGSNGMYPSAGMAPVYEAFGRGRHGYHSTGTTNIAPEDTELLTRGELSKLLRRADGQEVQLGNLLSRERLSPEGLEKMAQLRTELLTSYERIILTDIEFSDSQNVDQLLWKNVFYQVIERFRQFLKDHDSDTATQIRSMLLTLLDEGAVFFDSLLQSLQNTFQFKLEDYMDGMAIRSKPLKKTVKYALKSAQRCMICQGDIARYREQASNSANYGKARSWYLKAQQIAPKNGRPYNQLALLAVYTKRKLDAVYYYMRSLAASNPILTAKESLMSLFEEAKRKAEQIERRQKQDNTAPCGPPGQRISSDDHDSIRVEIWISPTRHPGVTSHTAGSKTQGLDSLSASDLNKRFILSFLHTHGKLFTKVGMENFSAVVSCMLQEFRCILQHSPCPLGNTRLLQIITINMFTIHYAQDRAKGQGESRSVLEEQSTFVGLAMFGLLVQRCTELLDGMPTELIPEKSDKCDDDDDDDDDNDDDDDDVESMVPVSSFQADLHELLPSVKVWSDWMLGHPEQWNPPPANLDGGPDVWQSLADLCNSLARVYHGEAPLYKADADGEGDEELHLLVLEEDRMLAGFVPLLAAPQEPCYIEFQTDPIIAADCKRVTVLKYFLEALCGQEEPLLAFKDGKYVSIAMLPTPCHSAVNKRQSEVPRQSQEDHMFGVETSLSPSEGAVDGEGNEDDLSELRARRSALTQELAQQQKRRDKIQAVLQNRCQMELEIRPFYLVPDTNAFIDHLEGLKKLLACGTYVLVVPLIVITELDGLAKGKCAQDEEYVDRAGHARLVQDHAKAAVTFLERGFEAREPGLRALTSRGNQLESIAFRSEDTGHQGNNDDVILSCCLHYCKDKARDFMPAQRDAPVRLFREVVLLTDDRNLRVKALTRNVPVRDIPAFLSWANVG